MQLDLTIMALVVILIASLIFFFGLHTFILVRTWKSLESKTRYVYMVVIGLALAYAMQIELYAYTEEYVFLNLMIHGLLLMAGLAILYPHEIITIQENEIQFGPFTTKKDKKKLLKAKILDPKYVRWFGAVVAVCWLGIVLINFAV